MNDYWVFTISCVGSFFVLLGLFYIKTELNEYWKSVHMLKNFEYEQKKEMRQSEIDFRNRQLLSPMVTDEMLSELKDDFLVDAVKQIKRSLVTLL
jgi:hypothetical protein